jgi:hypothetical protein
MKAMRKNEQKETSQTILHVPPFGHPDPCL